jgi:hemin uptake protein HemP
MEKGEVGKISADSGQRVMVPAGTDSPRRISSSSLLQGQRHIVIEHVGREYRLHLTAKGKLILTG